MRVMIAIGRLRKLLEIAREQNLGSLRYFRSVRNSESTLEEAHQKADRMHVAGQQIQVELCKQAAAIKRHAYQSFSDWEIRVRAQKDLRSHNLSRHALEQDQASFENLQTALNSAYYMGNSYLGWFGFLAPDPSPSFGQENLWRAEHVEDLGLKTLEAIDAAIEASDHYLKRARFQAPAAGSGHHTSAM